MRAIEQQRSANGLCRFCDRPAWQGRQWCLRHLGKLSHYTRRWRRRRRWKLLQERIDSRTRIDHIRQRHRYLTIARRRREHEEADRAAELRNARESLTRYVTPTVDASDDDWRASAFLAGATR